MSEPQTIGEVTSEFASVGLSIDHDANGPRLRIEDLKTGHVGYLDPLELETLAWLPEGALNKFLDPSFHRWRDEPGGGAGGVPSPDADADADADA